MDGVPISEAKFKGRMNDMIDEEAFKLVTLPSYFNSLKWQDRRRILLDVCGDVDDSEVILSDDALSTLPSILAGRPLEDKRKMIDAEKRKINDRLKEIPARIDELTKTLPTEAKNRGAIMAYIAHIENKIEKIKDNTELAALRKQLANAEVALSEAKAKERQKTDKANAGIEEKIFKIKSEIRGLEREIGEAEIEIKDWEKAIKKNEENMAGLRTRYAVVAAKDQPYEQICPTCNQPLPKDQIVEARGKFNALKALELKGINGDGKELKVQNEEHQGQIRETTHT
ncbi:hypothetical protein LCGC14_2330860, partial [marine sediment metagenome]